MAADPGAAPRKRIVLCCDGTWNKPDAAIITNVEKIARTVRTARPCDDGVQQVVEYVARSRRGVRRGPVLGGAFGLGLFNNVRNAYRFLALNYAPGDEVFVLGFSRGAYTARSVAGMVGSVGLLTRAGMIRDGVLRRALDLYRLRPQHETPTQAARRSHELAEFRAAHCHPAATTTIRFLGVFDTVGALGVPGMLRTGHQFHDITLGRGVELARQALAVDAPPRLRAVPVGGPGRRGRPAGRSRHRWPSARAPGVVRRRPLDVGGGYPEQGLSNSALRWMTDEARAAGLEFADDELATYLSDTSRACVHDSLKPRAVYAALNARERLRDDLAARRGPAARRGVFLPDGRRDLEPPPPPDRPAGRRLVVPVAMASTACEDAAHGYRPTNVAAYLSRHGDPADPSAYELVQRLPDGSTPPTPLWPAAG